VFSSAIDNWAFTIRSFAPKIAAKFGMNSFALEKFLWGKFYYIPSEKKVVKRPPTANSQEMFV
jgi:ribosome assembly protein 1